MIYVFDTSGFLVLRNYYPKRFETLWKKIDQIVASGNLISVREVFKELDLCLNVETLKTWTNANKTLFLIPENDELSFVSEIFKVRNFQALISKKNLAAGKPVADPFVIAAAKTRGGCVVTEEKAQPNAAKIPNICNHFKIPCVNLEKFMEDQGWSF